VNIVLIFFSSFIIALSGALVPGPLFTITVSESLRRGFKTGPLIIFGHGLLEITIVILLFFGITPFLLEEKTRQFISVAGGIILMIMGVMLFRDAGKTRLDLSPGERQTGLHPVVSGILGSFQIHTG